MNGTNGVNGTQGPAGPEGSPGPAGVTVLKDLQVLTVPRTCWSSGVNGTQGPPGVNGTQGPAGPDLVLTELKVLTVSRTSGPLVLTVPRTSRC